MQDAYVRFASADTEVVRDVKAFLVTILTRLALDRLKSAQKQREGDNARAAMLKAGPVRLRPILMTSLATMMAAVPPALALGPGAETRGPMAIAIIGGIIVSTLLSLIVVPAFYVVADRAKTRLGAWFAKRRGEETIEGAEPTP